MNIAELVPNWADLVAALGSQGDERLRRYVRQPSVSLVDPRPVPDDIKAMAGLVYDDLVRATRPYGGACDTFQTKTYPVATAKIPASDRTASTPTLCLYNMGDTRPIGDEAEWTDAGSLSAETVDVDGEKRIIGRGVHNSKSGLAGMIDVIELLCERRELPVNLEVIVDFEEEVRPDSVVEVVQNNVNPYRQCQAVLMPLMTEGLGTTFLAFKGIVVCRVKIKSDRPQVHSGMESILRESRLTDSVARFVDSVRKLDGSLQHEVSDSERRLARTQAKSMTLDEFAATYGAEASALRAGNVEGAILDLCRSHVNILGVTIGPTEGSLPTEATVTLEFRIGPSITLSTKELERVVQAHIEAVAGRTLYPGTNCTVDFEAGTGQAFRGAESDSPLVGALLDSYKPFGVELPLSPCCFGSVPEGATFTSIGLPFLIGGLGRGGNFHAPNEHIVEADYWRFKQWLVAFLHQFAQEFAQ